MSAKDHISSEPGAGLQNGPALDTVCASLGEILGGGVDVHRCLAARALGRIGASSSTSCVAQSLIGALLDEDEDVRTDAAEALFELGEPTAADQLLENLLGDPCTEVKLAAIDTLADLQDARVVPWLQKLVQGRDAEIAWDEEEFFSSGWDDWIEIQIRAIKGLARLNATQALPEIVAALHGEDTQDMTEAAFAALAGMGHEGIAALSGFLDSAEVRTRRRAAAVLAGLDGGAAEAPLLLALADPSAQVRLAALRARGLKHPDDPVLAALFEDPDVGVRARAVAIAGPSRPELLPDMLEDPSAGVQAAALTALEQAGAAADEGLVKQLSQKLNARAPEISAAAAAAFAALAPEAALPELGRLYADGKQPVAIRLGALKGLVAIAGEGAVEMLISGIDDDERRVRLETMTGLAKLARAASWPNPAGAALLSALAGKYDPESDPEARSETETETGEDEETPEGQTADKGHSPEAARTAEGHAPEITARHSGGELPAHPQGGTVGPEPEAAPVFPISTVESILAEDPEIAPVAALPELGADLSPQDMERLAMARRVTGKKKMAKEPEVVRHDDIRHFAARILGDLDGDEVAAALAACLVGGDTVAQIAAADSLARIGARGGGFPDSVTDALVGSLTGQDRNLKLLLIRALAACRDVDEVAQVLMAHLGDADCFVQVEAVRALAGLPCLTPEIETLLQNPDPSVRLSAAQALAQAQEQAPAPPRCDAEGLIGRLVQFALSFEGYHGRQTARILRDLDPDRANAAFLSILDDPGQKRVWSVAIEALEELNMKTGSRLGAIPDHELNSRGRIS